MVTDSMIQEAKTQYRKLYLSKYNTKYQENHIQITFRISKKQYKQFEKLAKKDLVKTSFYIKQMVLKNQSSKAPFDLKVFRLLLLQTIDITEEALEENECMDTPILLSLLKKMRKTIS